MGWVRGAPECMGWEEEGTRRMEEEEEDGRKGPLFILEGVDPPTGRKEGPRDQKDREAEEGKGKQPSKQGCDSEIDKQTGGGGGGTGSVDGGGAFGRRGDSPPLSFGSFPASSPFLLPFLTATLPSSILHGLRSQPRSSVWPKSGGVGRSVGVSNGRPSNLHPYFAWPPRNPLFLREERKEGGPLVASSSSSLCPSVRPSLPPPPPSTDLLFPPSSVGCSLHFPSHPPSWLLPFSLLLRWIRPLPSPRRLLRLHRHSLLFPSFCERQPHTRSGREGNGGVERTPLSVYGRGREKAYRRERERSRAEEEEETSLSLSLPLGYNREEKRGGGWKTEGEKRRGEDTWYSTDVFQSAATTFPPPSPFPSGATSLPSLRWWWCITPDGREGGEARMEKGRRRWRKKSPFLCARSEKRRGGRSLQLTCSNASRQTREEAGYGDNAVGDVRLPNYYTHPLLLLLLLLPSNSFPHSDALSLSLLAFFLLSRKEAAKCGLRKRRRRRGRLDPVRRLRFSPPPPPPRGGEKGEMEVE